MSEGRDEWLSTAEAARRLGVTVRDIYQLIDAGELTGYRFGRVIRLRREDVQAGASRIMYSACDPTA